MKVNGFELSGKVNSIELSTLPPERSMEEGKSKEPGRRGTAVEIVLLGVVMTLIWVSLSLPIIFFYLPVVSCLIAVLCVYAVGWFVYSLLH